MNKVSIILESLLTHQRMFGIRGVAETIIAKINNDNSLQAVRGTSPRFHVRTRTSDMAVYNQVFGIEQYLLRTEKTVRTVIDAGANIGASAVFFAKTYPHSQIIAIEPDTDNFRVLEKNIAMFPQIKAIKAGLWHEGGIGHIKDGGDGFWALQVEKVEREDIDAETIKLKTLPEVMNDSGFDEIDYLKIDIEGAEKMILQNIGGFFDKVNILVIECHDRWNPGCSRELMKVTGMFDYEWMQGDNHIFCKEHWLPKGQVAAKI